MVPTTERSGAQSRGSNIGLSLVQGPHWTSFEKLRVQGAGALSQIRPGTVGSLTSKGCQFRVLCEDDFQFLYGLARDVDRVHQGLRVVLAAVRTVQKHPDQTSVDTLIETALLLGDSPVLPTRLRFESLQPEKSEAIVSEVEDEEDEVELNPAVVRRPYALRDKHEQSE